MRLLVTGGRTGHLGGHVVRTARGAGLDVLPVGSVDADLRDPVAVEAMVATLRPEAVVHTAYVQSDWAVTATGAAHVAVAAARHGVRMVLVSSDVVFSGADGVYAESAPPDPITAYGAAKAAAETTVLAVSPGAVVARASLILGDGLSPHEQLFHRLAGGADGVLFTDEQRCPVHVGDLAAALVELAGNDLAGVLHVGGADALSRYDLGRLVALRDGLDADRLRPGSRAALGVAGPIDVRLDSSLAAEVLHTRLRGAREFLS